MSASDSVDPASFSRALRLIVAAFAGAIAVLTLMVLLTFPAEDPVPSWALLAPLALVAGALLLARTVGFTTTPLSPERPAEAELTALRRFQRSTIVRLVILEAPFVILIVASVLLPYGGWPMVAALIPGLAVLVITAWPSRRNVGRFADALEADGVRSGLREAFGHA